MYFSNVVDIWTPREKRSRDRWREKGGLVGIQVTENLSTDELAIKFAAEAKRKTDEISPVVVYKSEIPSDTSSTNSALYVLGYLNPETKGKKRKK